MNSSRLPGKALLPIKNNKSLIEIIIERAKKINGIDHICVATSKKESDDILVSKMNELGVSIFRGSLNDVLKRALEASTKFSYSSFLRICGDRPLFDPNIYSQLVNIHKQNKNDLTTNIFPRTVPAGLSGEVINFKVLRKIAKRISTSIEKEHITKHIYENHKNYLIQNVNQKSDVIPIKYKLTLDDKFDYEKITWIYNNLDNNEIYDLNKIMALNIKWTKNKNKI